MSAALREPRAMGAGYGEPDLTVVTLWIDVGLGWLQLSGAARMRAAFNSWPTDRTGENYLVISRLQFRGTELPAFRSGLQAHRRPCYPSEHVRPEMKMTEYP